MVDEDEDEVEVVVEGRKGGREEVEMVVPVSGISCGKGKLVVK